MEGGEERRAHLSSCCSGSAEQTSSLGIRLPPLLSLSLSDPEVIVIHRVEREKPPDHDALYAWNNIHLLHIPVSHFYTFCWPSAAVY